MWEAILGKRFLGCELWEDIVMIFEFIDEWRELFSGMTVREVIKEITQPVIGIVSLFLLSILLLQLT